MPTPSDSHLLREIDALRDCLADCLHRLDHVERRVGVDPAPGERSPEPAFVIRPTDPFEQALPTREDEYAAAPAPHPEDLSDRFTIRAVSLPDELCVEAAPTPPAESHAGTLHDTGWDTERSSGDGSPDPFAFLDIPTATEEPSEVYRGMSALLGGLDVSTQDEAV